MEDVDIWAEEIKDQTCPVDALTCDEIEEDEEDLQDTTWQQVQTGTRDMQGIPWSSTPYSREDYRKVRRRQYRTYYNREDEVLTSKPRIDKEAIDYQQACTPTPSYRFHRNWRQLRSTIVHFQLRNVLWCPTPYEMYAVHENRILSFDTTTRKVAVEMDLGGSLRGAGAPVPGIGAAQVCTLCVRHSLVAAGGFGGEVVAKRVGAPGAPIFSRRVTEHENGITNALEIAELRSGAPHIICSNNDEHIRCLDAGAGFACTRDFVLPWAVNATVHQPRGRLLLSVGDDVEPLLFDPDAGPARPAVRLVPGHVDFSFAAAWHPGGNLLATGNQDCTTRVYDIRSPATCLAVLKSTMGAVRSLRFSGCGSFLAAAEPADYVTLFDIASGFREAQVIDLFGELAGIAFTPGGDSLNIAVADIHYSSVLQFQRRRFDYLREGAVSELSNSGSEDRPWIL